MRLRRVSWVAALFTLSLLPPLARVAGAPSTSWKPAPAPLMTHWAKDVRPDRVRPEYPRPLAQRKEWLSLNGLWDFDFDNKDWGRKNGWGSRPPLTQRILVPFTYEAALSGIGKGREIHERVWYRRTFEVPSAWVSRRVLLNFNACDWETTVFVNGKQVGTHRGGYAPFSFDISPALSGQKQQEVVVAVYDPADPRREGYQPKGKQLGSEGIWYTRTTGIWQTVWLEPVDPLAPEIKQVAATVDPDSRQGSVKIAFQSQAAGAEYELIVSRRGRRLASARVKSDRQASRDRVEVPLEKCELWTPEHPVLYDLTLRTLQNSRVIDEIKSYCGFRSVGIKDGRLTLNGKPYFYRGVLDQGYWPDGILTPPTDAAIRADVEMTKRLGFNMARKHVKVEDPRWYYWCDRLGLAVWQDMPSSHNLSQPAAQSNFVREWGEAVEAAGSYPSVVHWIPFNENWGNPGEFQDRIVRLTRALDPTRPITDASGWTQRSLTDVIDAHDYSNNLIAQGVKNPVKPKVVGEYGGIALPVPGHTWSQGWGYQTVRNPDGLVRRIRYQTSQLFEAANLSGFVYTQLTDVEQELNGLLTYDRRVKADPKRIAAVFEGRDRSQEPEQTAFIRDWLVLGPLPSGTQLQTADNSDANRAVMSRILERPLLPTEGALDPKEGETVSLDGKPYTWRRVRGSDALDFHHIFGGERRNQAVYAVAELDVPKEQKNVTLLLGSDDGARVWLNGQQVWSVDAIRGVNVDQDSVPGLTLRAGRNLLVVKVGQGVGGWGLAARFESAKGQLIPVQAGR